MVDLLFTILLLMGISKVINLPYMLKKVKHEFKEKELKNQEEIRQQEQKNQERYNELLKYRAKKMRQQERKEQRKIRQKEQRKIRQKEQKKQEEIKHQEQAKQEKQEEIKHQEQARQEKQEEIKRQEQYAKMLEHERKIREIVYQQRELKRQEEQRKKEEFKKNFPELAKEKEEREERERQKKLLELQKASRLQHEQWQEELRLGKIKIEFLTQKNNSNTKKSNLETTMSYIDSLTGYEFEEYIANLLKNLGYYNVKVTPGSGDKGVDIFAEKNITNYAFQCKLNRHNNIGPDAVQEIFSGKTFYEKRNNKKISGIVVTNSFFSKNATEMANELDIVLWDRDKLIDLIKETQ